MLSAIDEVDMSSFLDGYCARAAGGINADPARVGYYVTGVSLH